MLDYRRAKLCNSCANVCESNTDLIPDTDLNMAQL